MLAQHPALASSRYRDAVVSLRPVQYWRLNESSGLRAYDEMGVVNGAYTGGIVQGVTGPPGIKDAAGVRTADGSGDYVDGGSTALSQTAYSLACWVFLTASSADRGIFGKWSTPGGGGLLWRDVGTGVSLVHTTSAGNFLRPGIAFSLNVWHFVAGTWNGATLRLYVDGPEIGNKAMATAPGVPTNNWWVGMYNSTASIMTGSLSEPAYWNRALSASEIAHLSALGFGR